MAVPTGNGLRSRRDSLPTRTRGVWGVRRSTPQLKTMNRTSLATVVIALACCGCVLLKVKTGPAGPPGPLGAITEDERLEYIRRAQVWDPTDVRQRDLARGPEGPKSFAPHQAITCDYVDTPDSGTTPKFNCKLSDGDVIRVKYGRTEGEVYAEVVATRLFWALGFATDAAYQVKVRCRDCPADPWRATQPRLREATFDPAMVERRVAGEEIAHRPQQGWKFKELDLVDAAAGGASRAQLGALTLLAAFVQHSDNSSNNQLLACPESALKKEGDRTTCTEPLMYISDLGSTFGRGNFRSQHTIARANYKEWSRVPMWDDPATCRAKLGAKLREPTLKDPVVTEAGRRFLADLLVQLTDDQIRDMFEAGTMDRRGWRDPGDEGKNNGTIDQWVTAFKKRRDAIVNHHCPS